MIPIVLITGFLGSGKTTLVRELYQNLKHKKICYLINEFSQLDMDGQILKMDKKTMISVTGGSIFCQCMVTQFISTLSKISQENSNWDALVIEASGISNPVSILKMLRETRLDDRFTLNVIINIVEPRTFVRLIETLPVIPDQIKAANYVLINKASISDSKEMEKSLNMINQLNHTAKIIQTDYCKIDFDPLDAHDITGMQTNGPAGHKPQPEFAKFSIRTTGIKDIAGLKSITEIHGQDIYRIKGFIKTKENEISRIDYSGSGWKIEAHDDVHQRCHIDFIFNQKKADEIRKAIRAIKE
jgi:G3E family GTPase